MVGPCVEDVRHITPNSSLPDTTRKEGAMDAIMRLGIKAMAVPLCIIFIPLCASGEQKSNVSQPLPSDKQVITIIEKPVKVTMKLLNQDRGYYQFELNVIYAKDKFRFETDMAQIKDLNEAISQQRKTTGWKGPYFFVGWNRGGGNASRGFLDIVFTIRGGQLAYIGEAVAEELYKSGSSYKGGIFRDVYNKFEINDLTSHAGSPMFWLVLEEKNGRLQVNLSRTWEKNSKDFSANAKTLRDADEILFNAVLAKYCQRKVELEKMIQTAKSRLDKEELEKFMKILSQVVPGELPRRSVEVSKERNP
jgi:hypothetical protein